MSTPSERRGSTTGSITGSIKAVTSKYIGVFKENVSHFLSNTSVRSRKGSVVSIRGNVFGKTKDALQSTDTSSDRPSEGQIGSSKAWIPITKAGSGGQVNVFFVISRDWLESKTFRHLEKLNKSNLPEDAFKPCTSSSLPPLSSGICVVKIPSHPLRTAYDRYRMRLQGLSEDSDFIMLRDFGKDSLYTPHLYDWDRVSAPSPPSWTVQEAFNCGTLYDFSLIWASLYSRRAPNAAPISAAADGTQAPPLTTTPWPEAFIWHVFIELALALHFIHCAGIAHCDLVAFNICLHMPPARPTTQYQQPQATLIPRFPRLIPIDFGRARPNQTTTSPLCAWDVIRLGDLLHEIVHSIPFATTNTDDNASGPPPRPVVHEAASRLRAPTGQRDATTGLCACALDAFTAEKRLSPRGQVLYREAMRYTAPLDVHAGGAGKGGRGGGGGATTATAQRKTLDDIVLKLVPQARKARAETYHLLTGADGELAKVERVLDAIVRRKFPTEDIIWAKMRATAARGV